MKNLKNKCLSVLIAVLTISAISGAIMAGTYTDSFKFTFYNVDNLIGNSGASSSIKEIEGEPGVLRSLTVYVRIQNNDYSYPANYKIEQLNTAGMNPPLTKSTIVYVGQTSDSWSARTSQHKANMSDGISGMTVSVSSLKNQTYTATQNIDF
jgi:hypothetical protein